MRRSKLGTMVAILGTAAGFSALADTAHAQISGTIGGDLVDNGPLQMPCDPRITLAGGNVVIEAGRDIEQHLTSRRCGGWPLANVIAPPALAQPTTVAMQYERSRPSVSIPK